ncbi:hypothetical protein RN001_002044 [Aquatica leii]|uniref:Microtubule-associated protein Jupiter n=1 Tax=Aquatica leii TaxID=1421715 RepID=A0AAN7PGU0_9COLE|nr:hypothetical protein RN001_002044 [Aquatica leii]
MTTYATYRHIELDKVGYGKKRVRNPPSDIFNVLSSPESSPVSPQSNGTSTPRRSHNDSFSRLFGSSGSSTPRRSSLQKHDVTVRNPVTGNGVTSWDQHRNSNSPRVKTERNPVTGEVYNVVSPASTPTKLVQNGFPSIRNGHDGIAKEIKHVDKPLTNGQA